MRKRHSSGLLALVLLLGGATACSEQDVDQGVQQVEDGAEQLGDEVEEQVDEGAEEPSEEPTP